MREVIFKNLWSVQTHKKDILLKEMFERDGVVAKTERRSFYFIKDVTHLKSDDELNKWVNVQDNKSEPIKRHFHIMKEHSDLSGTDRFMCKILGTFYAVVDKDVYTIAFLHSFKVSFAKNSLIK
ncbi:MAG: hypothetical protein Q8R38_00845 [Candidatus Omnitrophota bacterium]|nr:hypothetical protein [Candidatus Omnitrophota bacterium]